jgi:hypothetical protein
MTQLRTCAAALAVAAIAAAQFGDSFQPPGQHPSLLLNAKRLRLLRRERERQSPRWEQLEALIRGNARMPEPGFALALYYQSTGDEAAGRRAVNWALGDGADLRQVAFVFDWCQPVMEARQSAELASKCKRAIEGTPQPSAGIAEERSRVLAAIAIADRAPELAERELRLASVNWFPAELAAIESGRKAMPRGELYALFEMMHAVRDNLNTDLREPAGGFFKRLSACELLSYYPAPYPGAENEYRIPAVKGGEPDLRIAALARAADLAMVAYDGNALASQFMQSWLIHDRFIMRSAFAAPYEFLWANPYLPGVGYDKAPLWAHDEAMGHLFIRSTWDDDAFWAGYLDRQLQISKDSRTSVVDPKASKILWFGDTAVAQAAAPSCTGTFRSDRKSTRLNSSHCD